MTKNQEILSLFSPKVQSLDDLIEQKAGTGYYQLVALITVVFIDFNDGAESILMSLIVPILSIEWNLSKFQIQTLVSVFYFGMVFGSLISGKIADRRGRRVCIMFSCVLQFITAVSFSLMQGPIQAMVLRFIYGFVYGFSIPLTTTMVSEVTQQRHRGRFLVIVNFFVTIGKMYAFLLAYVFLDGFNSGDWRMMMIISSFTSLFVFIASKYLLLESPRFLIANGQYKEGLIVMDQIIQMNQTKRWYMLERMFGTVPQAEIYANQYVCDGMKYGYISKLDEINIQNWAKRTFNTNNQASYLSLVNSQYIGISLRLWTMWICLNYMYFGQLTILPFVLGKQDKSILSYFYTVLGEVPSIFISLIIIEIQWFGRRNTMAISFIITAILSLICYFYIDNISVFIMANSLMRFFMKGCWSMIYPYTSEAYNTLLRAISFGTASAIGRIGSSLTPYILIPLFYEDTNLPWLSFCILGIISGAACITLAFDTRGRNLDVVDNPYETEMIDRQSDIELIKSELKSKLLNSPYGKQTDKS